MKKPVKIMLWIVGIVIGLVILLALALPLWIGPVVTGVANGVVPGVTGTDFKLEKFELNPYTGKIFIGGVNLSNPKGYDEKAAFSLKSLSVDMSFLSVFSKCIRINDITIEDPFVSYVFDDAGSNNFARILANLPKSEEAKEQKPEEKKAEESKSEGKKVMIKRLCINGTKVKYRMITLPIPVPTLTNIGGGDDGEGATVEEVRDSVWNSVKDKFSSVGGALGAAAGSLTDGAASALKGAGDLLNGGGAKAAEGAKAATEGAKAAVNAVGDGAKAASDGAKAAVNAVGDGAKAAADGAKAVGEGAKDALKKVGNLFGK